MCVDADDIGGPAQTDVHRRQRGIVDGEGDRNVGDGGLARPQRVDCV